MVRKQSFFEALGNEQRLSKYRPALREIRVRDKQVPSADDVPVSEFAGVGRLVDPMSGSLLYQPTH